MIAALDVNAIRKDFVATEMHAIREAVSKVMQAEAAARLKEAQKAGGKAGGKGRAKPIALPPKTVELSVLQPPPNKPLPLPARQKPPCARSQR